MLRFALLLSLIFAICQAASATVVRVADGDCAGLAAAVTQAAQSSPASILLARKGNYSACSFNAKAGVVDIDAQGATFQFLVASVGSDAAVKIRNATITAATKDAVATLICPAVIEGFGGSIFGYPVICNAGTLSLESVTIRNVEAFHFNAGPAGINYGFINSTGTLIMRNATVVDNNDALFLTSSGKAEIYNSTFSNNAPGGLKFNNYNPAGPATNPQLSISNSVFAGSGGAICGISNVQITSLGGNLGNDASCGLSTDSGDKIVSDLALPSASDHGGLVPTIAINYGHPAYRAGVAQYCEATDARGVTRNAANCDAGAYESGGGLGLVTQNGMNGIYYVPGIANGHYVSVQRIHDNNDVMVFWNTFDSNGNPAWIYGVGTLTSDRHIHAQMARNIGGVLQPGGPATGAKGSNWGSVDIDLTSCSAAQFNYQSDLPEFGSGQFPLTRLAFESAINCGD